MKRWFISDTHFCHGNVIAYENRPFRDAEHMNQVLIDNWNSVVSDDDEVYHLGDFGLGPKDVLKDICSRLKGQKFLIIGNHDGGPAKMKDIGFRCALYGAKIYIGKHKVFLQHIQPLVTDEYVLHGHVHSKKPNLIIQNSLNISVEVWNYAPVPEKVILHMLDKYHSKTGKEAEDYFKKHLIAQDFCTKYTAS